jgi:phosphoribosylformylglycinamidine synthase
MICFFGVPETLVFVVETQQSIDQSTAEKLQWLFGDQPQLETPKISGQFMGPRRAMITPWSTNAVEITQNMGISGISRIETFESIAPDTAIDLMLFEKYQDLDQDVFKINASVAPVAQINDINAYNLSEGLALSDDEVAYLEGLSKRMGRPLTDSEVFGFSQVNSEHCRHKIFNGTFIIDGSTKESSLFGLIKKTSKTNPNTIVSAYRDNVAFIEGPELTQFAPQSGAVPSTYQKKKIPSVISLKAETHNFPTTVEPFNGAATGSGGEIRDRLAGGQGSLPLAGTAVYMTPYSRVTKDRSWEAPFKERPWRYQTPYRRLPIYF